MFTTCPNHFATASAEAALQGELRARSVERARAASSARDNTGDPSSLVPGVRALDSAAKLNSAPSAVSSSDRGQTTGARGVKWPILKNLKNVGQNWPKCAKYPPRTQVQQICA